MTDLAPILQGFFTDRLARQKQASPKTVAAYRDTCKLLLSFARDKTGKAPSRLSLADLGATLVGAFLQHLEEQRGNGSATRNARLAAIHSLFRYAPRGHPSTPPPSARSSRSRPAGASAPSSLPHSRRDRRADRRPRPGNLARPPRPRPAPARRPDRPADIGDHWPHPPGRAPGPGPHVRCHGKGRKDRATPLTSQTVRTLRTWLAECDPDPDGPLFPTRTGGRSPATPSNGSSPSTQPRQSRLPVAQGEERHPAHAQAHRRHALLQRRSGHLGHRPLARPRERGNHPDLPPRRYDHQGTALARVQQPGTTPGRYRPPDTLLTFLDNL